MDNKEGLKWFEYAENDFEAAKILSIQVKPKLEIVCYHCQQCAEKIEYYHMQNAISDADQIKEFVFSKLIDFEQLQ